MGEATALVDTVDTAAMDSEVSLEDTTASVRLRLSPKLLLSPTLGMVDTVLVDTAATAMEDSTGDTTASVRLRPSPTSAMEVTVTAMASKMFPSFCDHLPLNHLAYLLSCILTNK